jgi:hypothetical protein
MMLTGKSCSGKVPTYMRELDCQRDIHAIESRNNKEH